MAIEDRLDLYDAVTVDGNLEKDYLSSKLPKLTFTNLTPYTVPMEFVGRLDMISNVAYGTPKFGWLIGHVNNIMDPFFELQAGQVIMLPDLSEYYKFYNANVRV